MLVIIDFHSIFFLL